MDDLFDVPKDAAPDAGDSDNGGFVTEAQRSVLDALHAAGGDPGIVEPPVIEPQPDWDSYNAGQAAQREKDVAGGMDPTLANIINPDIDPENPYRIN